MTQEQIDTLPKPPFVPARDMMLCQRESISPGGLHLPDESVDKVQSCRVLAVGDGLVLDSLEVRKCPYKRGDRIFISPQDGYPLTFDGSATYWLVEVNEVMGQLTDDEAIVFGREIC